MSLQTEIQTALAAPPAAPARIQRLSELRTNQKIIRGESRTYGRP